MNSTRRRGIDDTIQVQSNQISKLSNELINLIYQYCDVQSTISFSQTCQQLLQLSYTSTIWVGTSIVDIRNNATSLINKTCKLHQWSQIQSIMKCSTVSKHFNYMTSISIDDTEYKSIQPYVARVESLFSQFINLTELHLCSMTMSDNIIQNMLEINTHHKLRSLVLSHSTITTYSLITHFKHLLRYECDFNIRRIIQYLPLGLLILDGMVTYNDHTSCKHLSELHQLSELNLIIDYNPDSMHDDYDTMFNNDDIVVYSDSELDEILDQAIDGAVAVAVPGDNSDTNIDNNELINRDDTTAIDPTYNDSPVYSALSKLSQLTRLTIDSYRQLYDAELDSNTQLGQHYLSSLSQLIHLTEMKLTYRMNYNDCQQLCALMYLEKLVLGTDLTCYHIDDDVVDKKNTNVIHNAKLQLVEQLIESVNKLPQLLEFTLECDRTPDNDIQLLVPNILDKLTVSSVEILYVDTSEHLLLSNRWPSPTNINDHIHTLILDGTFTIDSHMVLPRQLHHLVLHNSRVFHQSHQCMAYWTAESLQQFRHNNIHCTITQPDIDVHDNQMSNVSTQS